MTKTEGFRLKYLMNDRGQDAANGASSVVSCPHLAPNETS